MSTVIRATLAACAVLLSLVPEAYALDAFWHGVRSRSWRHGTNGAISNWYSEAPAKGVPLKVPDGVANFAVGALRRDPILDQHRAVGAIVFHEGVEKYQILLRKAVSHLEIYGAGITNNAAETPVFRIREHNGELSFHEKARIRGPVSIVSHGNVTFDGRSRAGRAEIDNRDTVYFVGRSSADRARVINKNTVHFRGRSNPGEATIISDGVLRLGGTRGPRGDRRITVGEIFNQGNMLIDSNQLDVSKNLTLGRKGTLEINIDNFNAGNIAVNNNAVTRGKLIVTYERNLPGRFTLIKGFGSRIGRFSEFEFFDLADLLNPRKGRLVYVGNEVQVVVRRK